MPQICTVTGTVTAPDGSPIAGALVRFIPAPLLARTRGALVTQPAPVEITASNLGAITVDLTAGTYSVRVRDDAREYPPFLVDVPSSPSAALENIVFHLSAPQTIYDAQAAARRAALAAFDTLNTFVVTDISATTVTIRIASHRVVFSGAEQIEVNGEEYDINVVRLEATV
jgi:hypothetical protein